MPVIQQTKLHVMINLVSLLDMIKLSQFLMTLLL